MYHKLCFRKDHSSQVGTLTIGGKDDRNCADSWKRYSQPNGTVGFGVLFNR